MAKFALLLFLALLFTATTVSAQGTEYQINTEKIHYLDPNRKSGRVGEELKPLISVKETGAVKSKVNIYIWGDVNEPFTRLFFKERFPILKEKYSDTVKFIYRHRVLAKEGEDKAFEPSIIAECVGIQNKFWENVRNFEKYTSSSDLSFLKNVNEDEVKKCMQNINVISAVKEQSNDGLNFGLSAIPSFIVQNPARPQDYVIKINGAQEVPIFDEAIKEVLAGTSAPKETDTEKIARLEKDLQEKQKALEAEKNKSIFTRIVEFFKDLF